MMYHPEVLARYADAYKQECRQAKRDRLATLSRREAFMVGAAVGVCLARSVGPL